MWARSRVAERWEGNSSLAEGQEEKTNREDPTAEVPLSEPRTKTARALPSLWGLACLPVCSLLIVFSAALVCICTLQA